MALVAEIVIPQYITKVQVSKKRRPKYYRKGEKLPKKHQKKGYKYNKKNILVDPHGKKVVKNKNVVNKPRYIILSGNNLISGYGSPFIRSRIARELKKFYYPFVKSYVDKFGPIIEYPLKVTWDVFTTNVRNGNWDASNMSFYYKYFEDVLVDTRLIPDDTVQYITWAPGPKIIPINNWEDRKFVFRFYYDNRNEIINEFK